MAHFHQLLATVVSESHHAATVASVKEVDEGGDMKMEMETMNKSTSGGIVLFLSLVLLLLRIFTAKKIDR